MSMNRHDPCKPLRHFIELVEAKCQELPKDIDHWIEMASKHEPNSKTHKNIIASSVKPREAYLLTLEKLHQQLVEGLGIIEGSDALIPNDIHLDMPVETMFRKYTQATKKLRHATENNQTFIQFFQSLLDRISFIRTDLNQTILRCSMGDLNYKDAEHQVRVLEPVLEESLEKHIANQKHAMEQLTETLIQKIEKDVAVRQSIQDRKVMHNTLQMYLAHIEDNPEFGELLPTLQYKIRQIVSRPLDSILSQQQQEVDVATYELQNLLEPVQGKMNIQLPDSATSVHQLIQQAISQQEEMGRLKMNVMGAFKHLVSQLDQMFQFQPLPPVQAASVLGAAWMQHPMTSSDSIREFKGQLDTVKKSDSYQKLMQYFGDRQVDESFKFVDDKMEEMAGQLEINERIEAMNRESNAPAIYNAADFCVSSPTLDPVKIRREIVHRAGYLMSVKAYIQQLCDSVKAHLYLVYYDHSLAPEKINLNARVNTVLNQISKEFYEKKNCDESIDRNVFMASVKQVFEEICDTELEKNMAIFAHRQRVKGLIQTLKETNKFSRKDIRKKIIAEKNELKQLLIETNIPRLKQFVNILSKGAYEGIHQASIEKIDPLKQKLRTLIQQKVALEQVVVL
tara:strand:- start:79 stop:1947 length:1869 start_codon:yes stop_codon:yes gene_type:complete